MSTTSADDDVFNTLCDTVDSGSDGMKKWIDVIQGINEWGVDKDWWPKKDFFKNTSKVCEYLPVLSYSIQLQ